ncbi:PhzF family phenazine biosynthesis protein [Paenibacillus sp. 1011MAR3C5]|nr:PhzF family phenazine biosynthesis protein [Paenibacillus sp. 1011MAR3C5]
MKNSQILKHITPDFTKISKISFDYQVVDYHLFTLDVNPGALAECRNFASLYDIPEESATGTSNGALLCYLWKNKRLPDDPTQNIFINKAIR